MSFSKLYWLIRMAHPHYCAFLDWALKEKREATTTLTFRSNPNFVPNLMLRTAYGAWLMLSEPPHRTTSDSLRQISYKHTNNTFFVFKRQDQSYILFFPLSLKCHFIYIPKGIYFNTTAPRHDTTFMTKCQTQD